jgi:hypothetical protein
MLEENGRRMEYQEYIEWKVKDILEGDEENKFQIATHFVKENAVNKSGRVFVIEEAVELVEQIRNKYGIKSIKVGKG